MVRKGFSISSWNSHYLGMTFYTRVYIQNIEMKIKIRKFLPFLSILLTKYNVGENLLLKQSIRECNKPCIRWSLEQVYTLEMNITVSTFVLSKKDYVFIFWSYYIYTKPYYIKKIKLYNSLLYVKFYFVHIVCFNFGLDFKMTHILFFYFQIHLFSHNFF